MHPIQGTGLWKENLRGNVSGHATSSYLSRVQNGVVCSWQGAGFDGL